MSAAPETEVVVTREVTVPLAPDRAFGLFTARMGEFWPKDHSIGSAPQADVVVEPRVGGRWYERGTDGSECDWGRVARWSPPGEVVLLWQLDATWSYRADFQTEVEVTFTEAPGGTRVELRHRHLERYGDQTEVMRAAFDAPQGWHDTLAHFVIFASS